MSHENFFFFGKTELNQRSKISGLLSYYKGEMPYDVAVMPGVPIKKGENYLSLHTSGDPRYLREAFQLGGIFSAMNTSLKTLAEQIKDDNVDHIFGVTHEVFAKIAGRYGFELGDFSATAAQRGALSGIFTSSRASQRGREVTKAKILYIPGDKFLSRFLK